MQVSNSLRDEYKYYDKLHAEKYRDRGQTFAQHARRSAEVLATDSTHELNLEGMFLSRKFLPAGRVQAASGAVEREVSFFNCAVSHTIEDSMESIMHAVSEASAILRLGTGIGYNFSKLRPKGDLINKLQSHSSGPVSFMKIFDVMASTIASSGHRRGAQMGIMNVDHPDIEEFIDAKLTPGAFRQFNLSVGVSDEFMEALKKDQDWALQFNGKIYKTVKAQYLWDKIMRNAYRSAEPGVIYLGRINATNNLYYCEDIQATNPCAEIPLPPHGLCLLGSFNLPKYVKRDWATQDRPYIDYNQLTWDIHQAVEAYDNIFEKSIYAIKEHKIEALRKRRIGLGFTGISTGIENLLNRAAYGEDDFNEVFFEASKHLRDQAYLASIELAKKRGSFPLFDRDRHCNSQFVKTLPDYIQEGIYKYGIRNSHLLSYAPCGTISQTAHNVSSGVEPVFYHKIKRDVYLDGSNKVSVSIQDYNFREIGLEGKTLEQCTVKQHIDVASIAQRHCDNAISKTINVPTNCQYYDYQKIYIDAYEIGSKGITVFRPNNITGVVITENKETAPTKEFVYGGSGSCVDGKCEL